MYYNGILLYLKAGLKMLVKSQLKAFEHQLKECILVAFFKMLIEKFTRLQKTILEMPKWQLLPILSLDNQVNHHFGNGEIEVSYLTCVTIDIAVCNFYSLGLWL